MGIFKDFAEFAINNVHTDEDVSFDYSLYDEGEIETIEIEIDNKDHVLSNDMRMLKFETLIKDIDKTISVYGETLSSIISSSISTVSNINSKNKSMLLIYDYNKLNNYGKIILDNSNLYISDWNEKYNENNLKDNKIKIVAAKEFIECCRKNDRYRYNFIFWAMMVLTVDKTDQEKHLSLICDFARMLRISDDEMLSILNMIKIIYHKKDKKDTLNNNIYEYFFKTLRLYENEDF